MYQCLEDITHYRPHHLEALLRLYHKRLFPYSIIIQRFFPDDSSLHTDHARFWLESFQWAHISLLPFSVHLRTLLRSSEKMILYSVPSLTQNSCGGGYLTSVLFRVVYGQTLLGVGWGNVFILVTPMVPFTQQGLNKIVKVR